LEETVEADISTWRKTGHFYFALTPIYWPLKTAANERELFAAKNADASVSVSGMKLTEPASLPP
jgi:hypothetical protein